MESYSLLVHDLLFGSALDTDLDALLSHHDQHRAISRCNAIVREVAGHGFTLQREFDHFASLQDVFHLLVAATFGRASADGVPSLCILTHVAR